MAGNEGSKKGKEFRNWLHKTHFSLSFFLPLLSLQCFTTNTFIFIYLCVCTYTRQRYNKKEWKIIKSFYCKKNKKNKIKSGKITGVIQRYFYIFTLKYYFLSSRFFFFLKNRWGVHAKGNPKNSNPFIKAEGDAQKLLIF